MVRIANHSRTDAAQEAAMTDRGYPINPQQMVESFAAQLEGQLPDDLHVYVSTDHDGAYPVGVASVVVARNPVEARGLLDAELTAKGLNPDLPYTLVELRGPVAMVLNDGEY